MPKLNIEEHSFTHEIEKILKKYFSKHYKIVFHESPILEYLNRKTKAASRGSKARGSFANIYALYVLIEDYIRQGFADYSNKLNYLKYQGARFSDLLNRQRELPFGKRLQNHALNSRLNDEFKKVLSYA